MTVAAFLGSQPAAVPRDLVFISYSHADKVWLERLRIFLKPFIRQNLQVWLDPYIEAGDDWRREISTALTRSSVGVLLVSANFLNSNFIYDEELPALLAGADTGEITLVPVPISASGFRETALAQFQFAHSPDSPLDGLPEPDRNAALVRIAEQIAVAARKAPDPTTRPATRREHAAPAAVSPITAAGGVAVLHGVPGQRPNYLRRQEYLDQLKQAVLGSTQHAVGITGMTPKGARIGLQGMGGIGKTVLAIDLVNDDEVRRAFHDGIFWLTLGQSIQPLQLQGELVAYIGGEGRTFATVNEARDRLQQLFEGKACLLVLDDLWHREDAEPFDALGERSRLLVTTRDADLLVSLGARELPLDVLSPGAALELLASWSGQTVSALPEAASEVAENCGYLPLALALAGARVQGGAEWQEVLAALERGRLEFLDHQYGSVFRSLRLSTDALIESERDRYFELAVFPQDADIPVETICTLWRYTGAMAAEASRDLLLRLQRRALLTRSEGGTRISFHDLQHDFLRLNIASLTDAHGSLVDAYRALVVSGWASGPDDGYFFQRLPHHLAAAERLGELTALLRDYDWLAAKLRATNVTAILADYDLVTRDLALVQQALRLSIPALLRDRSQLPGQLAGRLSGTSGPAIDALLAGAEHGPGRGWLRPRFASLVPRGPLRQILFGHSGAVTAVALSSNGNRALSGSNDNTLRLWDLATGETLRTLKGHTDPVNAVALTADGSRALSGSWDNTLRLWDLATGETLRTLEGHTHWVEAVAVLADGSRALSGSADGTLRLWDLATGETLRILEGHTTSYVTAVALTADGSRALSGSWDNTLRLWDLVTGEALRILEGHTSYVTAVALMADASRALSGSWDQTLRLWDLATGKTLRILEGHTGSVNTVALMADGSRGLSGSGDNTLRLWDLGTGETLRTIEGHTSYVTAVTLLPDGSRALSGSGDNTLRVWDLATGKTLHALERHTGSVSGVAVLADGRRALSGSWDNTLRLWDLATGKSLRTLEGHIGSIRAVAVFPDGSRALSGSSDDTLRVWDLTTGKTLCTLEGHTGPVNAMVLLAESNRALSGSGDSTLRLWDLATGKTLRIFEGHTHWVNVVALLADGRRALSSSWDNTLRLWDLATGKTLHTLEGHTGVSVVALQADGSRVLSGSSDNTLRLWDLATGETLHTLKGHTDRVSAVALLADGSRALSGSWDNTLRLWDLATGETLRTLEGHTGSVRATAVLADGNRALSGSLDNTLRLWDVVSGECLAEFSADAAIACLAFARDDLIVAGSEDGKIHVLEIREP
jgi:WD40 repeat protein